jgi:thiol-disulfide isomerase/thioredoxin
MKIYSTLLSILIICSLIGGCALESESQSADAGDNDGSIDSSYPPGPYGVYYGETIKNFAIEECQCFGEYATGRRIYASDFLDAKALMITIHAGWCPGCRVQAPTMEGFYKQFEDRGLRMILVYNEDEDRSSARQGLLDFCCAQKRELGMSFSVAIDPDADIDVFNGTTPMNILVDDEMVIRFKDTGFAETVTNMTLAGQINNIISETD